MFDQLDNRLLKSNLLGVVMEYITTIVPAPKKQAMEITYVNN